MYKIVVDSCGELPEELKKDGHFETVSLELEVSSSIANLIVSSTVSSVSHGSPLTK